MVETEVRFPKVGDKVIVYAHFGPMQGIVEGVEVQNNGYIYVRIKEKGLYGFVPSDGDRVLVEKEVLETKVGELL